MLRYLQRVAERWSNWVGDRDLELALRRQLDSQGYYGDSAEFRKLRLAAVQRPGWLQVFVFTVSAKPRSEVQGEREELYGIVRQDERYNRLEVKVFRARHERNQLFQEWSAELLRLRRPDF